MSCRKRWFYILRLRNTVVYRADVVVSMVSGVSVTIVYVIYGF